MFYVGDRAKWDYRTVIVTGVELAVTGGQMVEFVFEDNIYKAHSMWLGEVTDPNDILKEMVK